MRKVTNNIEQVKDFVNELKGKNLKIAVNKGRKKIVRYNGYIDEIFSKVFTLKINNHKHVNFMSCSFNDVICGDVRLTENLQ